ncbi:MAG: hypothetical protein ABSA63_02620 [Thermoplasmata archaeon]|jgi:hypothetical protein
MVMKSKQKTGPVTGLASGEDEKMHKIVDEVDRFFKSVHADIEDWKFSMEDYGDGTRIFVRFQIHINKSGDSPGPESSKDQVPSLVPSLGPATVSAIDVSVVPGGRTLPDGREVTEDIHEPDGTGAARQADLDLASFVEVWRGKQDSNMGGEYHKPGAPYVDAQFEWKGHTRTADEVSPDEPGERTDEDAKAPRTKA